jgi:hypothetical protein
MRLLFIAVAVPALLGVAASRAAAATTLDLAVSTDRPTYAVGEPITFTLTVTGPTSAPETLSFRSWHPCDQDAGPGAAGASAC